MKKKLSKNLRKLSRNKKKVLKLEKKTETKTRNCILPILRGPPQKETPGEGGTSFVLHGYH